ncbi:MAG: symmetrical bis(5'-nucleosyl)-tetraphosphatase [Gammaproteobacteria bacterium]|nr:symmetrical bis(5'-nucleosyl)-tetraphosphatase [Gammaproteobacteria bacterium]
MSFTYAIGDVQGCYEPLRELLAGIPYDASVDRLWFVGDLVNRGPQNLETLSFVKALGPRATTVLGNHDLHMLAIVFGGKSLQHGDTFQDVLESARCEELAHWLRSLPLLSQHEAWVMVHAGIPHIWTVPQAFAYAQEVEDVIAGPRYVDYFERMYGKYPAVWDDSLEGMDRWRIITNYLTRMRFIAADGQLEFAHKTTLDTAPPGFKGWFEYTLPRAETIVFGHWAALEGEVPNAGYVATDTGCVWGRGLTAARLEDGCRFQWLDGKVNCLQ